MVSMTTDSVLPRERAEFWSDLVSRHVTPMKIEPAGEQPLRGEMTARVIGGLEVASTLGAGVRASHTGVEVARASGHLYVAGIQIAGEARINRRGEPIALQSGDVFITDSREEFTFDLGQRWRHLVVALPTEWLDGRVRRPESLCGKVFRDHPLARLWATHLASGYALAGELSSTAAATLFANHSLDLLVQLLDETDRDEATPLDAQYAAIFLGACRMIAIKFGDPDLRPDQIAHDMNVSTRTVERAFAANGQTIMRCVLEERIRRATKLLTAPQSAHRSVTGIAYACGFRDASHFGRAFASRMGMTPSRWRLGER